MRAEDLLQAMNGIDDKIIANTYNNSNSGTIVHIKKSFPLAACIGIALFAAATVTAAAAIHHFWGRGMNGIVRSTSQQQQTLTEQGQAVVYPEKTDYSSYQVTDQGVSIAPETVIADSHYAFISFKVQGLNVNEMEEPGAELTYNLTDASGEESYYINGTSSFFDGTYPNEEGMAVYEDGSPMEFTENGELKLRYVDENGDLEYNLMISTADASDTLLGKTLHVEFQELGIYADKCEFVPSVVGKWNFDMNLPTVSNAKTIEVNKAVPGTECTIETIEVTPISIIVNYKIDGSLQQIEDCNGIPMFSGLGLKDGSNYMYLSNGGSSYFTDDSMKKGASSSCFQRIIDTSEIRSLFIRTSDYENAEVVEIELP
ncbi:DUF4179 domain-containing protein [Butyrivibrio sp. XBB1001]|uniref:DUF4179 domain-containing protein n=1 Tax=Butyrivibrio sp. XBB1001 TaxID=1280682 RepID=UPI0004001932|nr:DUF4179 domain-containing protein [Butyrivibrio sp. XBB1001]